MGIEHRYETRKPLVTNVVIQDHDQSPIHGQTRNISLGGMFVDIKHAPTLPVNTFVSAKVFLAVNKQQESFCAPALVVHSRETGAGLMFIELNADAVLALHQVMSDNSAQAYAE